MTPIEAFAMLRERCIEEIVKKRREVRDLSSPELVEILRLHGCPIPRFAGDDYAAMVAAYAWLGTEEGEREIARCMAPALVPGTRGVYSH
jgi:hypothetical protein